MDTLQPTAPPPTRPRVDLSRYAPIGYAVCSVAATIWAGSQIDVYSTDLDELTSHFAESGSTTAYAWSAYLLVPLAAVFLIWTLARFRTALDRAGRTTHLATAATVGGAVTVVAMVVGGMVDYTGAAVAAGGAEGDFPADPQTGSALMIVAGGLTLAEGLGAALLVWAVALGARRTGQVPGWLAWLGFVLVPLLPYAWILFMLPWLVFLVWLVTVGLMIKTEIAPAG